MKQPVLDPEAIQNVTDLLAAAVHIDRYLVAALGRLDEDFSEINALAFQMFKQLIKNKHSLNEIMLSENKVPGKKVTSNLEEIILYNERMEEKDNSARSRLQRLCTCCHRCFAFYDAIAETAADEDIILAAKNMAELAFHRMSILNTALAN